MPASAAFHFGAQASLLKYSIAASGSVVATADSSIGIGSGSWQVVSAYGSATTDWVLSGATSTSVTVTAPSGSGKSCILQYTVNGGGPTDPRTGQPSNGDLVKTAKLYIAPETIVPGETFEGDPTYGWAGQVNEQLVSESSSTLQADTIPIKSDAGTTYITLDLSAADVEWLNDNLATSFTFGWEQAAAGVGVLTHFRGQQGASGSVGGIFKIEGGPGGTGGTNLAGSVDIDLGRTVGGTSAKCRFLTDAGGAETERFSVNCITGGVNLWAAGADVVDLYAGSGIQLRTGGYVTLTSGTAVNVAPGTSLLMQTGLAVTKCTVTIADTFLWNFASGVASSWQYNGTTRIQLNSTGLGFFGATPVAQQADIGALTDNTAGTADNTLAALPDPADTPASADALRDDLVTNLIPVLRNNYADLAEQVNAIRTALRNLGLMA